MSELSDLEIVKLCADAMGHKKHPQFTDKDWGVGQHGYSTACMILYNPLENDAQAMALVKRFELEIIPLTNRDGSFHSWSAWKNRMTQAVDGESQSLNRAICLCVARLQQEKPRE